MDVIVRMVFGSHLYGTATENSDRDEKGVFMPSWEDILLGKIPKSISSSTKKGDGKNTSSDVDTEMYSLHYFLHLACKGETVALDMLHAPDNMIIETSEIWKGIVLDRGKFYTKNLSAFVGYARRQASKYGIKGSRLNDAKRVVDYLISHNPEKRMSDVWNELPFGEHIHKHEANRNGIKEYEVCGRKVQETSRIGYALDIYKKFYENYGKRAEMAARNEGVDFKAVSHALRAAFQVRQILTESTITFPLKEAEFLKAVKQGNRDYMGIVAPVLDCLMDEVEGLSRVSELPMKVDRTFWDKRLILEIEKHYDIHT